MNDDLHRYAHIPLKLSPNRVWRTYTGGALIDRWKKYTPEKDGNFPEEWIMSDVSSRGKNRPRDEGQSNLCTPDGEIRLKDLIASDPDLFLGSMHAQKFGSTGLLIKMLDSKERLTIQVHPDKEYARTLLNSPFGKTEAWYILNGREINGEKSAIYLGFKEWVTEELWRHLFFTQDTKGMLNCLHKFEVTPGDAFMIYGGVPHAIGSGCFLMEVQEPTDFTMRVEKTTPGGLTIGDELIHQGVGIENMLKCFHYDCYSFEKASSMWKVTPEIIESSGSHTLKSIIGEKHTDCLALKELELNGEYTWKNNGSFFVAVIYYGEGNITYGGKAYNFTQGDEIFFSAAIESVKFNTNAASKVLLCFPPN